MKTKLLTLLSAFTLVASGYLGATEHNLGSENLATGSEKELTQFLDRIKAEYGPDEASAIFVDIGFVVGGALGSEELNEAYSDQDLDAVTGEIDSLRNKALNEIDGITVDELREKAAPIEHQFRLSRKEMAQERLANFDKEKARVAEIRKLHKDVKLMAPRIDRVKDEYGFVAPEFVLTVENESSLTLRGIEVKVHAWNTVDKSVSGATTMQLMFDNQSIKTGDSFQVRQEISPLSDLASAVAQGAGNGLRMTLQIVYSVEDGRTEMNAQWTEQMEQNRKKLESYAEYDQDDQQHSP